MRVFAESHVLPVCGDDERSIISLIIDGEFLTGFGSLTSSNLEKHVVRLCACSITNNSKCMKHLAPPPLM